MSSIVDRARSYAEKLRAKEKAESDPSLPWWTMTIDGQTKRVLFSPPQTADEVRQWYPGAGVTRG